MKYRRKKKGNGSGVAQYKMPIAYYREQSTYFNALATI